MPRRYKNKQIRIHIFILIYLLYTIQYTIHDGMAKAYTKWMEAASTTTTDKMLFFRLSQDVVCVWCLASIAYFYSFHS